MFSPLIAAYLFLAGTGCGAFVAASILSWRARSSELLLRTLSRLSLPLLVASLGMVVVGSVCLVLDLGRPELSLSVLANPFSSILSIGAWSLVVFAIAATVLIACKVGVLRVAGSAVRAVRAVGCVTGIAVMTYSGLFLSTIWTLPFLASPLVPIIFVCSSLSCGAAVVLILPFACDADAAPMLGPLVHMDSIVLVIETVALAAFVVLAFACPLSARAVLRMVAGDLALMFWIVVALAGIAIPFGLELTLHHIDARTSACIGALVLVGGFALRYCFCTAPFLASAAYL